MQLYLVLVFKPLILTIIKDTAQSNRIERILKRKEVNTMNEAR